MACAENCHLEGGALDRAKSTSESEWTCSSALPGNSAKQYRSTYGIKEIDDGIQLNFVTKDKYGANYGSRVYMLESENKYQMFKLKNRELTMTADMFFMPCGLNGAVYLVEMDADGGTERAEANGGSNTAGAKYGTGYCDAQCPHDMKFMEGGVLLRWLRVFQSFVMSRRL